ncbi:hypothetical protein C7M61_002978 [Candidozyma pseudohaemuli]|uniref:Uncharacterized protein n=1 Tax=Candidozyma pseudohaemuli TaxID=418784 RepID=A0A2P7YR22_9ASCO|nr:hypothetical protein C7M61_002978 [[Candida] pseudohaemulonii]PSK38415.1 hypothetical protein C7M61_002978 [[Candida] pseudohaemulonii]
MKFVFLPLFALFSLLSFSAALPVEMQNLALKEEFVVKREQQEEVAPLQKRENERLTRFFASLNRTGAGVFFVRNAVNSPGINNAIMRNIADLFRGDGIEAFLPAADESGMALDLTLLFFTHWEVWDGLTDLTHYYRGTDPSQTGSLLVAITRLIFQNFFGDFFGNSTLGGLFNIFGGSRGAGPASGMRGLLSGLSDISSSASAGVASSAGGSSSSDSDFDGIFDMLSLLGGSSDESDSSSNRTTAETSVAETSVTPVAATSVTPVDEATSAVEAPVSTDEAEEEEEELDIEDLEDEDEDRTLAQQFADVASDVASFFKRSDDEDRKIMKRDSDILALRVTRLLKRLEDSEENADEDIAVATMDDYNSAWDQTTSIMAEEDLDSLGMLISLQKSGLGISVIHDALTHHRWHRFLKNTIEHLLEEDLLDLEHLVRSLFTTGVIWSVIGDILQSHVRTVLDFARGVLRNDVNVLGFLRALLT